MYFFIFASCEPLSHLIYRSGSNVTSVLVKATKNCWGLFHNLANYHFLFLRDYSRLSCSDMKRINDTVQAHSTFLIFHKVKISNKYIYDKNLF